ncbi:MULTISPECIES: Na+/H+ antiporter NhaC family protein [Haloprofundus]|uniref:Na+/H+ antiporter NhaC family protein n=1 Tax=Haloprofundus TaxID=1911573 RepID=UPI000E450531|nr:MULTISPECIES: Na+/H+ antiporter NhaC family protein [Haloprofundus]QCJ47721.1 Na+/H+ antiporter NhaC family protein [Haloprofundus sp. MHR1]
MAAEFGALSLVPPLLAIVLAIVTRKPILALFLGVWSGGVIYSGGLGVVQTFTWVAESIGDDVFHAQILIFTLLLGAGVTFIWRTGGSLAITQFATKRLDSQRKAGLMAWLLGLVWFFDDYANTAVVGSSMRDITDELRISREKLSYIVDSTAAPVATFGISSWVAYQISMVQEGYSQIGVTGGEEVPTAFIAFLQSIPFNMYCLFAIAMVFIVVVTGRDFGEMLDAEHRSWETGNVLREDAVPLQSIEENLGEPNGDNPQLRMFVVPVLVLVVVAIAGAVWTGYAPDRGIVQIAGNADFASALVWGSFFMVVSAMLLALVSGALTLDECMDSLVDGFSIMLTAVTILVLAWSISLTTGALGTGEFVTGIAQGIVTPTLLPLVVLFASAFIAFSTGTSWGTMAIVTPVAIPLAWGIGGQSPELIPVAVGTVFSGAIFGDHTSPISDTTILSSTFTGADHIDHVRTQLYYAVTVVLVASVMLLIYGMTGLTPLVLLPVGLGLLVALVYGLSEFDARRKGLTPKASRRPRQERDVADD